MTISRRCMAIAGVTLVTALASTTMAALPAGAAAVEILPGQAWSKVATAAPGSTVTIRNGTYPAQLLKDLALSAVTLQGETKTGVVVKGLQLANVSGLTIRNLTVQGDSTSTASAVRIQTSSNNVTLDGLKIVPFIHSGVDLNTGARQIKILNSVIDGRNVTAASGRGVRIFGDQADPMKWIKDVEIRGNDIGYASGDNVFIAGGTNVVITKNYIHHPQQNADHNDGIQSAGSDGLVIDSNTFIAPGTLDPDQAIILGHSASNPVSRVKRTTVVNNVIRDWRSTGIILAGTDETLVANNSVARTGTSTFRSASLATGQPYGYLNNNLRVVNNVFEKIDTKLGPITFENYNCVRTGGTGSQNVTADPQLADIYKLTLKSTSPCRNVASLAEAPLRDYGGNLRGALPDRGAWEVLA